jgi:hypothetical protein
MKPSFSVKIVAESIGIFCLVIGSSRVWGLGAKGYKGKKTYDHYQMV